MSIARWKRNLGKFRQLEWRDKKLLLRAVFWLAIARIMLIVIPLRRLLDNKDNVVVAEVEGLSPEFLQRVTYAISAAANHVPWRSDCFPQAIAARMLLKRDGYDSTMHIGVERIGDDMLNGHAWLTCGDSVVTGGSEVDRHIELLAD